MADSISWNLEAVFKESDQPTYNDDYPQWFIGHVFKMSIPCISHKEIGDDK